MKITVTIEDDRLDARVDGRSREDLDRGMAIVSRAFVDYCPIMSGIVSRTVGGWTAKIVQGTDLF